MLESDKQFLCPPYQVDILPAVGIRYTLSNFCGLDRTHSSVSSHIL